MNKSPLPVDSLLPEIRASLQERGSVILQAAPGSGKTTRVPPALLQITEKQVLVLEPRRLAARLSAERVAHEMGEECGKTTGYSIRFQNVSGPETRLKFVTEGLLIRMLMSDPLLSQIGCVVVDEFHERHIHTDVALAVVRHLQTTLRPDLKLVVMSATLDTGALSAYLPEAAVIRSETRVFPVEVTHLPRAAEGALETGVARAVLDLLSDRRCTGHVLVFLPGTAEIRRAADALREIADRNDCSVLPLYADLSPAEQRLVFDASVRRKIILSTNVAETSITIEGVTGVVDSGLARIAGQDPLSGLPTLDVKTVSQSSCIQRAGRAGRTAPGIARRLFTAHDFAGRRVAEKPEIQRLDLTQIILELTLVAERLLPAARLVFDSLTWLEPPPESMVRSCRDLLQGLGAVDSQGVLTSTGREMSSYSLHPRLGRVLVESRRLNILPQAVLAVSLLNEEMILKKGTAPSECASSDVSFQMDLFRGSLGRSLDARRRDLVHPGQVTRVRALVHHLARQTGCSLHQILQPVSEESLSAALLAGFPDRVARVRRTGDRYELDLCTGGRAFLSQSSVVRDSQYLLALEAESARGQGSAASTTQIRVASGLEPEALLSAPGNFLSQEESFNWDASAERSRGFTKLRYGSLVIEETPIRAPHTGFEQALKDALRERWPAPFDDDVPLQSLMPRCAALRQAGLEADVPDFINEQFDVLLSHICSKKSSFAEIRKREISDYLADLIPEKSYRLLAEHAPDRIPLKSGRKAVVHYESGKPPWVAAPLQEFFGMVKTPAIAKGRIPLVVHLLAPNGRDVQVTQDLAGFWERHYPGLRKQLSRRYPKHSWPEIRS
jgi:ATP-dependent helicase HrpB